MNVTLNNAMVFRNEKDGRVWFNISDSSKQKDGTYVNKSWAIRFKQGNEPTDKSKINVTNAFMTYYPKDEKTIYTTIQCMEWEYMEQPKKEKFNTFDAAKENDEPFSSDTAIEILDSELPF